MASEHSQYVTEIRRQMQLHPQGGGNNPFSKLRNKIVFDIYPGGQQQLIQSSRPSRGCAGFTRGSGKYLERAGNATNCNRFNFQGDAVTSKFGVGFWIKFGSFSGTDTIMCKAIQGATMTGANSVWALQLGSGTGKRIDLYISTGAATPSVSWTPVGLAAGVWYFVVITYDGSGGAAKAECYINGVKQTTPNSTSLPQKLQNNNGATCNFAIGRKTANASDGSTQGDFDLQQLTFHEADPVLTQQSITDAYNSGRGIETDQFSGIGTNWNGSIFTCYDLTEAAGATRISSVGVSNDLTDTGTVPLKSRYLDFVENSPNVLAFQGGSEGPSNAIVRTRNREPWKFVDKYGAGKHGMVFEASIGTLYCPTGILTGVATGTYLWAGTWDTALASEFFEMVAGDDTLATGEAWGNNHSMFMGMLGPSAVTSGLSAGEYAPTIRPDGTSQVPPFGGVVHNLAQSLASGGGHAVGNSYPPSGTPVVFERTCYGPNAGDYRLAINGVQQSIIADGISSSSKWFDDFINNFILFGFSNSGASACTMARAVLFSEPLSIADAAIASRMMKTCVGL